MFPSANHSLPLFVSTTASEPKAISSDSWRKAVGAHFRESTVSTHSWRRGGAAWYIHEAEVPEEIVQALGGWVDVETMRKFQLARQQEW